MTTSAKPRAVSRSRMGALERETETRYKFVDRSNEPTPQTCGPKAQVDYCPICGCKLEEWPDCEGHIWKVYCDGCKNRCTIWVLH